MRKIILYIATSIDGLIAGENSDLEWLDNFPNPRKTDYGYNTFYESIDTIVMGANTYRYINESTNEWPHQNIETYLISHSIKESSIPNVHILNENWVTQVKLLKEQKEKNIWILGGGEILSQLLEHNLVDKMIISQFPVLLGKGTQLFHFGYDCSKWEMAKGRFFTNGVIQAEYIKKAH